MKNYILIAASSVVSSVVVVLLSLLCSTGAPRKKLLCSLLPLAGAALVCFGGEAVLALFDMGWRCTPYNAMLSLCVVLFFAILWRCIVILWRCMNVEKTRPAILMSGTFFLLLAVVMTVMWVCAYFTFLSWNDYLAPHNGQMIVCANDMHGGSCSYRYYVHINSIVHGGEIVHDGSWWGRPPLWS